MKIIVFWGLTDRLEGTIRIVSQQAGTLGFRLSRPTKVSRREVMQPHEGLQGHRNSGGGDAVPVCLFSLGVYHTESRGRQAMGSEQMDYAAFLADLEGKRQALDQTITAMRLALSIGALGPMSDVPPAVVNGMLPGNFMVPSISGGEVPNGAFLGLSIPDATKLYLEIIKKKQTSREIADALQKGGMETNSKNFPQMVHSVLDRASKANTGIVKLDRSHWGLATWYPASLRSAGKYQGRGAGRRKVRKARGTGKTQLALKRAIISGTVNTEPVKKKANERAEEYLHSQPLAEHSLESVGHHLGIGLKGTRLILGKLVKAGKARVSAPGMYTVNQSRPTVARMMEAS